MKQTFCTLCTLMLVVFASPTLSYDNTTVSRGGSDQKQQEKKKIWNNPKTTKPTTRTEATTKTQPIQKQQKEIPAYVLAYARNVYSSCAGAWKSMPCISTMAQLSKDMTINYAQNLEIAKQESYHEYLKQRCAASTAALQEKVPAYAQKSAMTECLNTISDLTESTGTEPDLNLYQLAVGGVQCLDKEGSCNVFEEQLSPLLQNEKN